MTQEIPAVIRDMHTELEKLELVDRIRAILTNSEVTNITNLVCWIETRTEEGRGKEVVIRAVYRYTPKSLLGRRLRHWSLSGCAEFRVEEGQSFGPVTAKPLEDDLVLAVCNLAKRFYV